MKRNIGKFAANIAAAGMLLGAAVAWADDQQSQQSSTSSQDQSQQAGQSGAAASSTSSDPSGQAASDAAGGQAGKEALEQRLSQAAADPQQFIKIAYQENLAEVKAGQLAEQKAANQQTKDFAQSLVQDHQQALDQLKKLADQKNVQVSDQLGPRMQRLQDEMASLSGADFDKRFMNQQIRAHKRAIALYQAAAQNNTDSEVKQFAQQNLSGLQHHLQMAQQQGGISEPAGAGQDKDQGAQGAQGSSSSSSSSQDQSGKSGQSGASSSSSSQPDQSQSAQPK